MSGNKDTAQADRLVTVRLREQVLVGSGQNISQHGIYFVVDGPLRVRVLSKYDECREGVAVRLQELGEGKLAVAALFE